MSYVALGRLASRRAPPALRRLNATAAALLRRSLSAVYGSSSSAGEETGEGERERTRAPLNAEWAELARKQLKGADPAEALSWKTPEVSELVAVYERVMHLVGMWSCV